MKKTKRRFLLLIICLIFVSISMAQNAAPDKLLNYFNDKGLRVFVKPEWIEASWSFDDSVEVDELIQQIKNRFGLEVIRRGNSVIFIPSQQQQVSFQVRGNQGSQANQVLQFGNEWDVSSDIITISGRVKSANEDAGIPGVLIYLDDVESEVTNQGGGFEIEVEVGAHELKFSTLGMEPTQVSIRAYQSGSLEVDLFESSTMLEEVVISEQEDQLFRQPLTSVTRLDAEDIRSTPSLFGQEDILQVATISAGVTTIGEGAAGVNIRGGQATQNQILLDDITLYSPYHLFGLIASFNPYIIDDATIYKGGIPAEYGGWVSSVLQTESINPSADEFKANLTVGIVNSSANLEVPLVKDRLGLMVNGRVAYPDYLINNYPDVNLNSSSYAFQDMNAKLNYRLADSLSSISLQWVAMEDRFTFGNNTSFGYANNGLSLSYNKLLPNGDERNIHINRSGYGYEVDQLNTIDQQALSSKLEHWEAEYRASKHLNDGAILNYGAEFIHYQLNPGSITYNGSAKREEAQVPLQTSGLLAGFMSYNSRFGSRLTYDAGLRVSAQVRYGDNTSLVFSDENRLLTNITDTLSQDVDVLYPGVEPRFNLNFNYAPKSSIKFSYQRTRQFLNQVNNSAAISPIDIWTLSNDQLKPVLSNRIVIGWFKKLWKDYQLSVEGYGSLLANVYDFRQGGNVFRENLVETAMIQGDGRAYGIEFSLDKKAGKVSGNFNYTYSRSLIRLDEPFSEGRINEGNWYAANFDVPHRMNINLKYDISRQFDLAMIGTWQTGRPVTFPTSLYVVNGNPIVDFNERNNFRIPAYARFDLSVNWFNAAAVKNKKTRTFWNLTIYNITGRDNILNVFFEPSPNNRALPQPLELGIIQNTVVSISYNLTFNE